ncbi:MAG: hypothetical protein ABIO39_09690 [Caulobacteraceae bacterium]
MLFLLNDTVINVDPHAGEMPLDPHRFRALTLEYVIQLGAELYSEQPMLHREDPERARRLALLIMSKAPEINAALFVAPTQGCPTNQVISRFANVGLPVMAALNTRQNDGSLTPVAADREVWRRLAA